MLRPDVKIEMSDIIKFVKSFQIIMLKKLSTAADEEEIRKKQITDLNEKVLLIKINHIKNNKKMLKLNENHKNINN